MVTARFPHRVVVSDRTPVLRETNYERTTAALSAVFLLLCLLCILLITIWLQFGPVVSETRDTPPNPPDPKNGGVGTAVEKDELRQIAAVESPNDQPVAEFIPNEQHLSEVVAALADSTAKVAGSDLTDGQGQARNIGDGGAPLGSKPPQRHQWMIEVSPIADAVEYARMLDQFGIELGAVFEDGTVTYLSRLADVPTSRRESSPRDHRFFTTWNDGALQQLDEDFFRTAAVDITRAKIVHLFPYQLEEMMERQMLEFVGRSEHQIQRTWFRISRRGGEFEISVTRQTGAPLSPP